MPSLRSLFAMAACVVPALSAAVGVPSSVTARAPNVPKAVFAHYMLGGLASTDQARADIQQAKDVGFDAFALNTKELSAPWATNALALLFNEADATNGGFKLFFSFDMSGGLRPTDIPGFIQQYASRPSYYQVDGRPFVSTFWGGNLGNDAWQQMRDGMSANGQNPFFVPEFDDKYGYENNFFSQFPVADGAFSWETAWPQGGGGSHNVGDSIDTSLIQQAHDAGKIYMMPVSTFQFKYLEGNNYFRIGGTTIAERFEQILRDQPDLVELITWNDAGEGHYVGNFYDSQIAGSTIGDYANGFDHTAWQNVIRPFISAYKTGAQSLSSDAVVGSFWYRTLLVSASCSSSLRGHEDGRDTANFAVVLPGGSSGWKINVYSNGGQIGSFDGTEGLNYQSVQGVVEGGDQRLEVVDGSGNVVKSVTGTKNVNAQSSGSVCNWNYEVVGF